MMHHLLRLIVILNIAELVICLNDLLASRKYCGFQHVDDYNRENDKISIDEFPWIAQLLYDDDKSIKCTGALINTRYVLTAGHCLYNPSTTLTGVRLGDFNVTSDKDCIKHYNYDTECSDPVQEFEIGEKIRHPKFKRQSGLNDIGLVRLSRPAEYSDYVRPICLPLADDLNLQDNQELAVSGWGAIGAGEQATNIKKKILTRLTSHKQCKEMYDNLRSMLVSQFHLCATETEAFTCQGDSGGPLMLSVNNQWVQVGILSFGRGCGSYFPSVYVKTANYLNWIKGNLRE